MLKGKCRHCGKPFPARSMIVELASGLLFVLALTVFGLTWQTLVAIVFGSIFLTLFVTDFEKGLLPDLIVYPGIATALAFAALGPLTGTAPGIISALAGLGICFGAFFIIWAVPKFFKKEMMAFRDVGMAGLVGASIGFPTALVAIYMAIMAAGLAAALLVALKVRKPDESIEFGLFLSFSAMVTLFFGGDILDGLWQMVTF